MRRATFSIMILALATAAFAGVRTGTVVAQGDLLGSPTVESNGWAVGNRWGAVAGGGARVVQNNIFWFIVESEGKYWLVGTENNNIKNRLHEPWPNDSAMDLHQGFYTTHNYVDMRLAGSGKHPYSRLRIAGCRAVADTPVITEAKTWYDCP